MPLWQRGQELFIKIASLHKIQEDHCNISRVRGNVSGSDDICDFMWWVHTGPEIHEKLWVVVVEKYMYREGCEYIGRVHRVLQTEIQEKRWNS